MDIKYLSDDKGKITGVFIPIAEWERLQKEYRITEEAPADSGAKLQQSLAEAMKKVKPDNSAKESTQK
ncbi:hypothetical protein [Hymenobacter sp.]|uniref:hypothetical protein n=1 Tax=Hymenobacter sp. TaxID=1898978 RepID=UPI00286B6F68|nr:hypothetical protein [Hymenobacter sp.]